MVILHEIGYQYLDWNFVNRIFDLVGAIFIITCVVKRKKNASDNLSGYLPRNPLEIPNQNKLFGWCVDTMQI